MPLWPRIEPLTDMSTSSSINKPVGTSFFEESDSREKQQLLPIGNQWLQRQLTKHGVKAFSPSTNVNDPKQRRRANEVSDPTEESFKLWSIYERRSLDNIVLDDGYILSSVPGCASRSQVGTGLIPGLKALGCSVFVTAASLRVMAPRHLGALMWQMRSISCAFSTSSIWHSKMGSTVTSSARRGGRP